MVLDVLDPHRLKRAVAHVQRQRRPAHAGCLEGSNQRGVEVQACRGRGDRPPRTGEDGLIPLSIGRRIRTMNVGRQRDVAERVDRVVDVRGALDLEPDETAAEESPLEHLGPKRDTGRPAGILEYQARAGLQFLAGVHERVPVPVVHPFEQHALGRAAARVAAAEQPRGKHPRVVDDEKIAGREQVRQIANARLVPRARVAVDNEEARRAARRGVLGDQRLGEVEVEIGDEQALNVTAAFR
jgi:hypothetical protein